MNQFERKMLNRVKLEYFKISSIIEENCVQRRLTKVYRIPLETREALNQPPDIITMGRKKVSTAQKAYAFDLLEAGHPIEDIKSVARLAQSTIYSI